MRRVLLVFAMLVCMSASAMGQIVVPGANGSDGTFAFVGDTGNANVMTINLAQAVDDPNWDANTNSHPGWGVYDRNRWAVIFRYQSVTVPSGKTVQFSNHVPNAPVVWLVSADVTINGTVNLNGQIGVAFGIAASGPGGFRGGHAGPPTDGASAGFGPGGSPYRPTAWGHGGSYATAGGACNGQPGSSGPTYGNAQIIPLIGGSGGAARHDGNDASYPPGGGGGAILIAASGTITLSGGAQVMANGGGAANSNLSSGSGGGIRLVADVIAGGGLLRAVAGPTCATGGDGRIRVERNGGMLNDTGSPHYTDGFPGNPATLWPPAGAPTITATMLPGQPVPTDPHASLDFPSADIALTNPNPVVIQLHCTNVPINSTVTVRVVPKSGPDFTVNATFQNGDMTSSDWQTATSGANSISLPDGFSAIQARVVIP